MRLKIRVPGKNRRLVRIALVALPVFSLLISAVTLPWILSVIIGLTATAASAMLDRVIFVYQGLLVMPGPSPDMHRFALGIAWSVNDPETLERIGFSLVYKYRKAARHSYDMLKSWNYGRLKDESGNITMSIVRETGNRLTIIFYPGERLQAVESMREVLAESKGPRSEVQILVAKCYLAYCVDVTDSAIKQRIVDAIPSMEFIELAPAYVENDDIHPYAKRPFLLGAVRICDRAHVPTGTVESLVTWSDPRHKMSDHRLEIVDRLDRTLKERHSRSQGSSES